MTRELLTIQQAARLLGVTAQTLRRWDASGKLRSRRHPVNNYRVYDAAQVEALLAARDQDAASQSGGDANLVSYATSFVGRQNELATIAGAFVAGTSVVTVTGPPGVGKSRLTMRFADLHSRDFPGGRIRVDLRSARSSATIATAMALALGVPLGDAPESEFAVRVARSLAARLPTLVLLDGFDHLVTPTAELLSKWVASAPDARWLLASRVPAAMAVSEHLRVEPLAQREAATLFDAAARRANPAVDRSRAHHAAVLDLVQRLEGLPLAIELAAAHSALLTPAQMVQRLSARFDSLGSVPGIAGAGRNLRAALDESWDALSDIEREALCRCAIFPASFSADAAEAVLTPFGSRWLGLLESLRTRSLLRSFVRPAPYEDVRLELYDSVRAYARERIAHDVQASASKLHSEHYAAAAERWMDPIDPQRLRTSLRSAHDADLENLRVAFGFARSHDPPVAVRLALALDAFYDGRVSFDMRLANANDAMESAEHTGVDGWRARAHWTRADVYRAGGRVPEMQAEAAAALALARSLGVPRVESASLRLLALGAALQQRWDEAVGFAQQAIVVSERAHDAVESPYAITLLGAILAHRGDPTAALPHLQRALAMFRRSGNVHGEVAALDGLAEVQQALGRPERTVRSREQCMALQVTLGDSVGEALAALNLANACLAAAQWPRAAEYCRRALRLSRTLGQRRLEVLANVNLASALILMAQDDAASEAAHEAVEAAESVGTHASVIALLCACAMDATRDDVDQAREIWQRAQTAARAAGDPGLDACCEASGGFVDLALARRASARGDVTESQRRMARVWALASETSGTDESSDVRLVRSLLGAVAHLRMGSPAARTKPHGGIVHVRGAWFVPPAASAVDLRGRLVLARLLRALARHAKRQPGEPLTVEQLFEAGWPSERINAQSRARRVWASIAALRRLGLAAVLRHAPGGYRLETSVIVSAAPNPPDHGTPP